MTVADCIRGIRENDRAILGKAITMIESSNPDHQKMALEILAEIGKFQTAAIRIGLTGAPGVGKSTFADAFGTHLTSLGKKVAVLAVDPSSAISGGSILGDKTRMQRLTRDELAFIRPSPSGKTAGGIARRTRETILLCEAAGYEVVMVETVGVGQGETAVRSMVDFNLLLMQPGSGDDLQAIKRGIVETADAILVSKNDGGFRSIANQTKTHFEGVMRMLRGSGGGWEPVVLACSSVEGTGISEVWEMILSFSGFIEKAGGMAEIRRKQALIWYEDAVRELLEERFFGEAKMAEEYELLKTKVLAGEIQAVVAARELIGGLEK